jgi:hypothetical protein
VKTDRANGYLEAQLADYKPPSRMATPRAAHHSTEIVAVRSFSVLFLLALLTWLLLRGIDADTPAYGASFL